MIVGNSRERKNPGVCETQCLKGSASIMLKVNYCIYYIYLTHCDRLIVVETSQMVFVQVIWKDLSVVQSCNWQLLSKVLQSFFYLPLLKTSAIYPGKVLTNSKLANQIEKKLHHSSESVSYQINLSLIYIFILAYFLILVELKFEQVLLKKHNLLFTFKLFTEETKCLNFKRS